MNKLCILFSCGIDSYIAYRMAVREGRNVELLHINIGQPYYLTEQKAMERLGLSIKVKSISMPVIPEILDAPDKHNITIPGRNMFLGMIAMMCGATEIWICGCEGEMSYRLKDKNPTFFYLMSSIGSFVFQDLQGDIKVCSPFEKMSKLDAVLWALNNGVTVDELKMTTSCLAPCLINTEWINCGECKACVRRAGILRQLSINEKHVVEPFSTPMYREMIEGIRAGKYKGGRAKELDWSIK